MRLPTYVQVSKKTTKAVNLNVYRNLHHHHLNSQKKNFADEVKPLLRDKPRAEKVWIHYEIFAPRNGRLDTMNVGSIADKYFSDTLVEAGKLPDDNYDHIVLSTFSFGGVCPMDGHAIATVNILEKETAPMRVLLDQDDIQAALDAHVKSLALPGATGVELSVTDDGEIEAEVLMGEAKPKNKGGRPRGSKNKTTTVKKPAPEKEEETDVDETGEADSEGSSDDADSGGDSAPTTDAEAPAEEPSKGDKPTETKGKTAKGNLFGDSDEKASSDSQTSSEDTKVDTTEEGNSTKVKTKKSSIFDV